MSSDDDEDFVTYGTPLEPLDEDAIPKKKAYTSEAQYARDSSGRRRFHGAFTGGFSAGFMNTVGSLEGWKPAEFKSTRADRAGAKQQTAADFMDEEDLGEFGIAPSRLTAKMEYSESSNKRKKALPMLNDGPIPGIPVLEQLLQNVRETMGIRLLKSMGWKPGQGVGPRVSVAERLADLKKTYGCEPPPGHSAFDSDDEDLDNISLAPLDVQPYLAHPKKDTFGLGYSGLDRHSVLGNQVVNSELRMRDAKGKVNIRGQAFGVGAFEEDDEDIYCKDDMSQYDFTMGGPDPKTILLSAITAPGVLPGFVQANHKVVKKSFPLPKIPAGFRGRHEAKKSRFAPAAAALEEATKKPAGLGRHDIDAQTRSVLLNENTHSFSAPTLGVVFDSRPATTPVQIKIEPSAAAVPPATASSNFKPFLQDPDKQARYELFLGLKDKSELSKLQPLSLNEWEREREQREFEQAARIFRPLSGVMEDRFTRAEQPDDSTNPLATVEKMQHRHGNETKRNAARMKMFGEFTRDVSEWVPCALLCKRFNVPQPGTSQPVTNTRTKPKYSIFDSLDALVKEEKLSPPRPPPQAESCAVQEAKAAPAAVCLAAAAAADQPISNEPLFVDPETKVDLFKAIFLDSSDDEDSALPAPQIFDEPAKNVVRNTSPPRGLFANIDLDALSTKSASDLTVKPSVLSSQSSVVKPAVREPTLVKPGISLPAQQDAKPLPTVPESNLIPCPQFPLLPAVNPTAPSVQECYGPKLPDKIVPVIVNDSDSSSSSGDWQEVSSRSRKSKKSKKHKKHKSKKKKHKRK